MLTAAFSRHVVSRCGKLGISQWGSSAPLLYCEQTSALVILLLFGLSDLCGQIKRLLKEVHQRLLGQQGRQDLSVADRPLALAGDL